MLDVILIIVSVAVLAAIVIGFNNAIIDAVFNTAGRHGFTVSSKSTRVVEKKKWIILTINHNPKRFFNVSDSVATEEDVKTNNNNVIKRQTTDIDVSVVRIFDPKVWSRDEYIFNRIIVTCSLEEQVSMFHRVERYLSKRGKQPTQVSKYCREQYKLRRKLLKELENGVETP